MSQKNLRVLSIQSHVVSGYVGNKSATFPLQLLGFEVDPLNSVNFSNHSGYPIIRKGNILKETDLDEIISGLQANKLDYYTHLLTGYIYSPSFLTKVADLIKHLRKVNPDLIYVCDPVMGDNGKMYVPEELLDIYKTLIVPLADIVTPNHFEAQLLTGQPVKSREDVCSAIEKLHSLGSKTAVVSSTTCGEDRLLIFGSSKTDKTVTTAEIYVPKLDTDFTGTGDLFAALLLGWMEKSQSLPVALEKATSTIQAVLKRTYDYVSKVSKEKGAVTKHDKELKIIQSKADIENPEVVFSSTVTVKKL